MTEGTKQLFMLNLSIYAKCIAFSLSGIMFYIVENKISIYLSISMAE